jgi:hypothetical protein
MDVFSWGGKTYFRKRKISRGFTASSIEAEIERIGSGSSLLQENRRIFLL